MKRTDATSAQPTPTHDLPPTHDSAEARAMRRIEVELAYWQATPPPYTAPDEDIVWGTAGHLPVHHATRALQAAA